MVAVSFSLTEKIIIDPVLTLRAPLSPLEPVGLRAQVWQGIQSEVVARVVAVFASLFAAADALVHVWAGCAKGMEGYAHFKQAAWFVGFAIVGSIGGIIWPGFLKNFRYSPLSLSDRLLDAPPSVRELVSKVEKGAEPALESLKLFWRKSSLEEKHWFVKAFSGGDGETVSATIREKMADTVYQPMCHSLKGRKVEWLSERIVGKNGAPTFYHATTERALQSILQSKQVEVRHEKVFRGAFVSTMPERDFGNCILVFNRNIERLSPLEHGFQMNGGYWAGFSHNIPVTASTLESILLDQGTKEQCNDLARRCTQWAGREIRVIPLQDFDPWNNILAKLSRRMGIPSEWPSVEPSGRATLKSKILDTLQTRARIAIQIEKSVPKEGAGQRVLNALKSCEERVVQAFMQLKLICVAKPALQRQKLLLA